MGKEFYIKRVLPFLEKGAEAALCTYLFFIPFSHVPTLKSFAIILFPSLIIFKILIEKTKKFSAYNTPLTVPLFLFTAIALVSAFSSIDPSYSLSYFRSNILIYLILYFGITILVHDISQIKRLIFVLMLSYFVIMFYGLFEYFILFGSTAKRFNATFGRYNTAGMYSIIFIPTAFSLFLWYKKLWHKVLLGICLSGSLLGVLFTQARAAWVCLFLVAILIGIILDKRILAFVFISLVIFPFILPQKLYKQGISIFDFKNYLVPKERVLTERPYVWKASIAMIKNRPILGFGTGTRIFGKLYNENGYRPKEAKEKLSQAHNQILQTLVENGVLGILCFLWIYGVIIKYAYKAIKTYETGFGKCLLTGIFSGIIGIFIFGTVDTFMRAQMGLAFWVFTGLFFAIIKTYTPCDKAG